MVVGEEGVSKKELDKSGFRKANTLAIQGVSKRALQL